MKSRWRIGIGVRGMVGTRLIASLRGQRGAAVWDKSKFGVYPIPQCSDGAKTIRLRLLEIFGMEVTLILDWYHLSKKVRDLMSMIALNKEEKSLHLRELFQILWRGQAQMAVDYLQRQVHPKNPEKLAELVGYLQKHESEIIDYERRKQVGKQIGSGRVEKAVDQVIGHRQKQKGSSWRSLGSKALAILRILELNGEWQRAWFPSQMA